MTEIWNLSSVMTESSILTMVITRGRGSTWGGRRRRRKRRRGKGWMKRVRSGDRSVSIGFGFLVNLNLDNRRTLANNKTPTTIVPAVNVGGKWHETVLVPVACPPIVRQPLHCLVFGGGLCLFPQDFMRILQGLGTNLELGNRTIHLVEGMGRWVHRTFNLNTNLGHEYTQTLKEEKSSGRLGQLELVDVGVMNTIVNINMNGLAHCAGFALGSRSLSTHSRRAWLACLEKYNRLKFWSWVFIGVACAIWWLSFSTVQVIFHRNGCDPSQNCNPVSETVLEAHWFVSYEMLRYGSLSVRYTQFMSWLTFSTIQEIFVRNGYDPSQNAIFNFTIHMNRCVFVAIRARRREMYIWLATLSLNRCLKRADSYLT